jgi:hypothetical protein
MLTYAQILDLTEGGHFTPFAHLNHRIIRFLCHCFDMHEGEQLHSKLENARLHFSLRSAVRAYEVFGTSYAVFVERGICGGEVDERLACDLYAVYRRRMEADVADYLVVAHA